MKTLDIRRAIVLGALAALGFVGSSFGQTDWPQRTVTIIVPTPAGGPADAVARFVALKLQARLGQSVIVDNKAGAGGNLGVQYASRAKPDGYTIAMGSSAAIVATAIDPKALGFDIRKDFEPLTTAGKIPLVLAANNDAPFSNFKEFVAYAKAHPGKLSVGVTPGLATSQHVLVERIKLELGIDVVPVPYKGSGPANIALTTGEIPVALDIISGVGPFIAAGKIKPLAIMTQQRNPDYPNMQSIAEQGYPGLAVLSWNGFLVPKGTPKNVVERLQRELIAIMREPDTVAKLRSFGQEGGGDSPQEFVALMTSGLEMWTKVIRDANLKLTQ